MPTAEEVLASLDKMLLPVDEFTPDLKSVIYGPSGVGKTVLAFEIAQAITKPDQVIMYIDSAQGIAVLNNHPDLKKRVKRIPWGNLAQQEYLIQAIAQGAGQYGSVGCLIYDEFSNMVNDDLDDIMKVRAKQDPSSSPDQAILQDYNKNQNRMMRLVNALVSLDRHVILIAHDGQEATPSGLPRIAPNFRQKFGPLLKQPMHLIGYLVANDVEVNGEVKYQRALQIQPTKKVDAKSRIGTLTGIGVPTDVVPTGIASWLGSGGTLGSEHHTAVDDIPESNPESDDDTFAGIEV